MKNFFCKQTRRDNNGESTAGIGYIDRITSNKKEITIEGWGLQKNSSDCFELPKKFLLYDDDHEIGFCLPNVTRKDVCEAYNLPATLADCGFRSIFTYENIGGIENRLSIHYETQGGDLATICGPYACCFPLFSEKEKYSVTALEGLALSITTKCNLRCKYCFIQSPDYNADDMDKNLLQKLLADAMKIGVKEIHYGIMGEPRVSKELVSLIHATLAQGHRVSMASNFATPLTPSELDAFVLMHCIEVSVDSFDPPHLKQLRGADARNILMNICQIKALGRIKQIAGPHITLSIVCNELNVPDLPSLAGICASIGVNSIQLLDMRKPYIGADFSTLPPRLTESTNTEVLRNALHETVRICKQADISISIDSITEAFLNGTSDSSYGEFEANTPEKPTRLCIAPWSRMYVYPNGDITPCFHFSSVGKLSTNSTLSDCLNAPRMRSLRKELLTGHLVSGCQNCCRAVPCSTEKVAALVKQYTENTTVRAETFGQPVDFTFFKSAE